MSKVLAVPRMRGLPLPGVAWRVSPRRLCYGVVFGCVAFLTLCPLLMLLLTSVNLGPVVRDGAVVSLANYVTAWSSSATYTALANTLLFAAGSTAVAVILGVLFAFL